MKLYKYKLSNFIPGKYYKCLYKFSKNCKSLISEESLSELNKNMFECISTYTGSELITVKLKDSVFNICPAKSDFIEFYKDDVFNEFIEGYSGQVLFFVNEFMDISNENFVQSFAEMSEKIISQCNFDFSVEEIMRNISKEQDENENVFDFVLNFKNNICIEGGFRIDRHLSKLKNIYYE